MSEKAYRQRIWHAAGWATCAGYFFIALIVDWFEYGSGEYSLVSAGLAFVFFIYSILTLLVADGRLAAPRVTTVMTVCIVSLLVLSSAVPPIQTDFYHYFFEDVAWLYHGQNPYLVTPADMSGLAVSQLAGWQGLASQHGPVRLYSTLPAALAGMANPTFGPFLYKLFFALITVGALLLFYDMVVRLAAVPPNLALMSVAWSPLVLYETELSGGTDVLMVFWLLLSISLLSRKHWYWAIAALAASVLTKYVTVLLLPFMLYYIAAQQPTIRRAAGSIVTSVALFVGVVVACFAPFWVGPEVLASTAWVARHFEINSVPGAIGLLASLVVPINFETLTFGMGVLFLASYAAVSAWYIRRRVPTLHDFVFASVCVVAAFLLAKSWFYPKYLIWLLPLMAMLGPRWVVGSVFFSGVIVLAPLQPDLIMLWLVPPVMIFILYRFWRERYQPSL